MTPTRAAAERLRRIANGELPSVVYAGDNVELRRAEDEEAVIEDYLAMVPADDEALADEAWLLEQKEHNPERTACGVKLTAIRPYVLYEYEPECGLTSWYLGVHEIWKRKPVTRKMVRRLLAALGVGT